MVEVPLLGPFGSVVPACWSIYSKQLSKGGLSRAKLYTGPPVVYGTGVTFDSSRVTDPQEVLGTSSGEPNVRNECLLQFFTVPLSISFQTEVGLGRYEDLLFTKDDSHFLDYGPFFSVIHNPSSRPRSRIFVGGFPDGSEGDGRTFRETTDGWSGEGFRRPDPGDVTPVGYTDLRRRRVGVSHGSRP